MMGAEEAEPRSIYEKNNAAAQHEVKTIVVFFLPSMFSSAKSAVRESILYGTGRR